MLIHGRFASRFMLWIVALERCGLMPMHGGAGASRRAFWTCHRHSTNSQSVELGFGGSSIAVRGQIVIPRSSMQRSKHSPRAG